MIDDKFSALAFSDAGFGTEEARALSRQLQEAIVQQLSLTVGKEMEAVIAKLNFWAIIWNHSGCKRLTPGISGNAITISRSPSSFLLRWIL